MQESDDEVFEPDNCSFSSNTRGGLSSLLAASPPYDRGGSATTSTTTRFVFPHLSNNDSGYETRGGERSSHSFSDLETCSLGTPGLVAPGLEQQQISDIARPTNRRIRRISETMTSATTTTMRTSLDVTGFRYQLNELCVPGRSINFASSASGRYPQYDFSAAVSVATNTAIRTATNSATAPVAIICSNQKSNLVRRASWPGLMQHLGGVREELPVVGGSAGGSLGRSPDTTTSASPRHHLCSVGTQTSGSFESLLDCLSLGNDDDEFPSDNELFDDDNVFSPSPVSTSAAGPVLASSVPDVILPVPTHCRWSEPGLGRARLSSLPLLPQLRRADEPLDRYYGRELRRFADHFSAVQAVTVARRRRRTWSVQEMPVGSL